MEEERRSAREEKRRTQLAPCSSGHLPRGSRPAPTTNSTSQPASNGGGIGGGSGAVSHIRGARHGRNDADPHLSLTIVFVTKDVGTRNRDSHSCRPLLLRFKGRAEKF